MTRGQLIEQNMRKKFFLEKSYTKRGEKMIPFSKQSKLSTYLDQ